MAQFDPCTIHIEGHRLPGDRWGLTRTMLSRRCKEVWDVKDEAAKSAVKRAVAELLRSGRLEEITVTGDKYLVAIDQRIGGDIAAASLF